jgi:hypothetical protein
MIRKFIQRSYPGKYKRPNMSLEYSEKDGLLIALTPWGSSDASHKAAQVIKDYYLGAILDPEATSPFPRLAHLSNYGNTIRIAYMVANDAVYQAFNKDQYNSACELLILSFNNRQVSWVQVGQPHLLLLREGKLQPLNVALDLGLDYNNPTPLPAKLLGLSTQSEVETKDMILNKKDRLVLCARSQLPDSLLTNIWSQENGDELCQSFFNSIVTDDADQPFWLAVSD